MTWRELPPLDTDVAARLPSWPELCLVAGPVDDYADRLWPEESGELTRAAPSRVRQFSSGRFLAREAMADLGVPPGPIPRTRARAPSWPAGVLGSISHAREIAVAAVARSESLLGLGVDLERTHRISQGRDGAVRLHERLFTAAERARFHCPNPGSAPDPRLPGLLFSAKEAGYKAVNPVVGRYIGFQEAQVDVDWCAGTFRLHYLGDHAPNRLMEQGRGYFCFFGHYVLTVFMIPR